MMPSSFSARSEVPIAWRFTAGAKRRQLHHPVFRPAMTPARVELLVLEIDRLVNLRGIERRVDHAQQRHDVGLGIADAANLETILVDVDDLQAIFPDAHFAQLTK